MCNETVDVNYDFANSGSITIGSDGIHSAKRLSLLLAKNMMHTAVFCADIT